MTQDEYKLMREILDDAKDIQEKVNILIHEKAILDSYPVSSNCLSLDEFNNSVFRMVDDFDVTEESRDLGYHE
jgi:hypothetical protein